MSLMVVWSWNWHSLSWTEHHFVSIKQAMLLNQWYSVHTHGFCHAWPSPSHTMPKISQCTEPVYDLYFNLTSNSFQSLLLRSFSLFLYLLSLPLSTSVCPLFIISLLLIAFISLPPSVNLSMAEWSLLWELFDDYLLPLEVNGPYGFCQPVCRSACVCVGLWLLGDGDAMKIKGWGWVRFKPIYCRSVDNSRSRGKPYPPAGFGLVYGHLVRLHISMTGSRLCGHICMILTHCTRLHVWR